MVERVIVAVDGGPASDAAVAWVIDRAKSVPMNVAFAAVTGPLGAAAEQRTVFENALASAKEKLVAAAPGLSVTTALLPGTPHETLIEASAYNDLLVVGSNKTAMIAGAVNGTLALKVAGKAECTTIVVPAGWQPNKGKVVAGWSDDRTAEAALDFAASEAMRRNVGLTIVHTWSAPPAGPIDVSPSPEVVVELLAANRELLAEAAHRVEDAHPGLTVTQGLHEGSPAISIVRVASDASLIVVGSRGRGAIASFFLGSVGHEVLVNLPAPVAVVPKRRVPVDVYPELLEEDLL